MDTNPSTSEEVKSWWTFRLTIEKSTSISQQGKVEARCAQNNNLCSSTSVNQELFLGAQYSVPYAHFRFEKRKTLLSTFGGRLTH